MLLAVPSAAGSVFRPLKFQCNYRSAEYIIPSLQTDNPPESQVLIDRLIEKWELAKLQGKGRMEVPAPGCFASLLAYTYLYGFSGPQPTV